MTIKPAIKFLRTLTNVEYIVFCTFCSINVTLVFVTELVLLIDGQSLQRRLDLHGFL